MVPHERLIYEPPYGPPCPKACHGFALSQVDVLQYLYDLLRPNALDLDCPWVDGVRFVGLQEAPHVSTNSLAHGGALVAREQGGETADVVAVFLHAPLVDVLTCRSQAPPPIGTYSLRQTAKRSLNLSIPLIINSKHSIQDVFDLARDARVVPHVLGKG